MAGAQRRAWLVGNTKLFSRKCRRDSIMRVTMLLRYLLQTLL